MRILQLCNKYPFPANDGGNIAITNLTEGFIRCGHDVTILAMSTFKHPANEDDIPEYFKKNAKIDSIQIDTDIKLFSVIYNLLFSKLPYNAERFLSEDFSSKLIELLKKSTFDIIQLEGLYLCHYIPLIRKYSKAKIAYRAHNIEHEIWQRSASIEKNIFKKIYYSILTKRLKQFEISKLNEYDLLIPITQRDKKILGDIGNKKDSLVTPCGINIDALTNYNEEIEYPSLFYIGALDWTPNIDGLIWFINNVWSELCHEYADLKFYVAGRNAADWFIKTLHKRRNIIYLGEIENAYKYMGTKAVMIVPLFSGSGMRVKIVEGLALGKVIITTRIGAEGLNYSANENILIANTSKEFLEKIDFIINDKKSFDRISLNASTFIKENFDNFQFASALIKFYESQLE